jgi:quaternary ammonium compound-resistance protein SugE
MAWVYLVLAGVLEVVWAVGLKYSEGFSKLWPSVITLVATVASFWLLALALKHLPLGTGYAIWVGIGAVGTACVGMLIFKEPATVARIMCIGLIVAGIIGLKLTSGADAA